VSRWTPVQPLRPSEVRPATRRPGREGVSAKVTGSARSPLSRHRFARFVPDLPGTSHLPMQSRPWTRGRVGAVRRLSHIWLQATNGRSRRLRKAGRTVTSHGSSSRNPHFRDRPRTAVTSSPGEFAETCGIRGKVRTHRGGRARTCDLSSNPRPSRLRPQPAQVVAGTAASISASGPSYSRLRPRAARGRPSG
jgi:hypothetical protein